MQRFDVNNEAQLTEGIQFLQDNGYAVFGNVLSQNDIDQAKNLFWDFLEQVPGNRSRQDPDSWYSNWPADRTNGIIGAFGIGQSELLWFIRGKPSVRKVFSLVWETEDLITSFDGANAFRPWDEKPDFRTDGGWFHVDQNYAKIQKKETVQGLVSLYDATPETGGLTVLPRSHLHFEEIAKRLNVSESRPHYIPIPDGDPIFELIPPKLVTCKAGDLLLWDSRTIHCNSPGGTFPSESPNSIPGKAGGKNELLRAATYVCMTPRASATAEVLADRRVVCEKGITSSHWPHRDIETDAPNVWEFKTKVQLSAEQAALI